MPASYQLVPPYIEKLRPYEPGRSIDEVKKTYGLTRVAKLASNENPLGPSPLAVEAIARGIASLNYYPNGGLDLRVTSQTSVGISYVGQLADRVQDHSVKGSFTWRF